MHNEREDSRSFIQNQIHWNQQHNDDGMKGKIIAKDEAEIIFAQIVRSFEGINGRLILHNNWWDGTEQQSAHGNEHNHGED